MTLSYHFDTNYSLLNSTLLYCILTNSTFEAEMRLWRDRFPGKTIVAGESKELLEEFARLELCLRTIDISKSVALFVTVSMCVGGVEFCSVLSCRVDLFYSPSLLLALMG